MTDHLKDHLKDQIRQITNADFQSIMSWMALDERRRRFEEKGKADLVLDERRAGLRDTPAVVVPPGRADEVEAYSLWEDPGTIHDRMYGLGDRVRHDGRVWESTHPGLNHWPPGGDGVDGRIWRDVTDELTQAADEDQGVVVEDTALEPESPGASGTPAAPEWRAGTILNRGDQVTHDGKVYSVVQSHTAQVGWEPPNVPALFTAA